jgi:hypothetical protein
MQAHKDCIHILDVNRRQQKSQRLTFGIMDLDKPKTERGTNGSRTSYTGRGCFERVDAGEAPLALNRNVRGYLPW